MEDYGLDYRAAFPLMCGLDILDAHDYCEEVLANVRSYMIDVFR